LDQLWLKINDFVSAARSASMEDWLTTIKIALQLVIIAYAAFWTWGRIRGTQAERLVKGVMILTCAYLMSWLFGLKLITSILQSIIPVAVVSLVIIFQPELRRGLGYLGRTTFRVDFSLTDTQRLRSTEVIMHIINAVRELSRDKIGALIVVEPPEGERDYLSPGTTINADVSSHLLLSIFQSKAPLHDGAVVIRSNKIVAAGVILPVSDNQKLSYRYGTRHRAAIGLSELYDGLCIVVSEETGGISAANRGMLVRYNTADDLADPLSYFYYEGPSETKADNAFQSFLALFGNRSGTTGGAATPGLASGSTMDPLSSFDPNPQQGQEGKKKISAASHEEPEPDSTAPYLPDIADDDIRPHASSSEPV
jgi:diadenylate cyclase